MPGPGFEFNAPNFKFDGPHDARVPRSTGFERATTLDVMVMPPGRGRLGIGIQELTPQLGEFFGTDKGVLVTSVQADSPAAKAGLKAGDVITALGDAPVSSPSDLMRAVRRADEGSDADDHLYAGQEERNSHRKAGARERKRSAEPI